jgi:hypothetical protein
MFGIIATISVLILLALYVGLWVWDQVDPDPYDNEDYKP